MTKVALEIFRQLHDNLVESGISKSGMNPAARDGYAALWLWMSCGQPIERLTIADVVPVSDDFRPDTAELRRQAVGYILPADPRDWVVLARVAAHEAIRLDDRQWAYPDCMLVYCGWRGGTRSAIFSGCINLAQEPTVGRMAIKPGRNYGELGSSRLTPTETEADSLAVAQCFGSFFRIKK